MDKLVADGKLTMKLFNKSQVYWVAQSAFEDVSEEAMAALAAEEARVGGEAAAARDARRTLAAQAASMGNALTAAELEASLVGACGGGPGVGGEGGVHSAPE